jgi:hypothetical protein
MSYRRESPDFMWVVGAVFLAGIVGSAGGAVITRIFYAPAVATGSWAAIMLLSALATSAVGAAVVWMIFGAGNNPSYSRAFGALFAGHAANVVILYLVASAGDDAALYVNARWLSYLGFFLSVVIIASSSPRENGRRASTPDPGAPAVRMQGRTLDERRRQEWLDAMRNSPNA